MMKLLILMTVFLIKLASSKEVNVHEVIDTETKANYAECFGSLLVVTNRGEISFGRTKSPTYLKANSLEVEGCGCFDLYKRRNFRGTSLYISHYMGYISGDYIGFTIRSVKKVPCYEYTKSTWGFGRMLGNAPRRHHRHRHVQMLQKIQPSANRRRFDAMNTA